MSWQDNVENLVKIGQLKKTPYVEEDVGQYVANAKAYLEDAKKLENPGSRFQLAYEGMHALSMTILNKAGVRGDASAGYRQVAFQTLTLNAAMPRSCSSTCGILRVLPRLRLRGNWHWF